MSEIDTLLKLKENINCELKSAENGVPNSIYETYSAFCNTIGGTIYLGITENKHGNNILNGISNPDEYIKNIFNTLNNKSKISKNILSDKDFYIIPLPNNKFVLAITIPEIQATQKPVFLNNNLSESYKRNYEGDYKITNEELQSMFAIKTNNELDNNISPIKYYFEDINLDSLTKYRNILNNCKPDNIFTSLSNYDFCKAIGILRKADNETYCLTRAGVLLFTDNVKITSIYPNYFLDYQEHSTTNERYDFRISSDDFKFSGNLFDFFLLSKQHLISILPNRFELYKDINTSGVQLEIMIREAFVNAINNADFFAVNPIIIHKYTDRIIFTNSGEPIVSIEQMLNGGMSIPRNKEIVRLFRVIGYCEKTGYGIPTILSIAKQYYLPTPTIERLCSPDRLTLSIYLPGYELHSESKTIQTNELVSYIAKFKTGVSSNQLAEHFDVNIKTITKILQPLILIGVIKTNGKATKGRLYYY